MRLIVGAVLALIVGSASAHDYWNNGKPIPPWVKGSCCGKADAHYLPPDKIHFADGYYEIEVQPGTIVKVNATQAIPSQDGDSWIFWQPSSTSCYGGMTCTQTNERTWCFFTPLDF